MSTTRPAPTAPAPYYDPDPPHRVRYPLMRQRWRSLTFLHWPYPVPAVQRLLPPGFEVEPWEDRAWVGLVPLHMSVRPPIGPAVAGITTFPETNLRTYVTGPDGRAGVWFLSLDAANLPAVGLGRLAYGLPYFLATMDLDRDGDRVTYGADRVTRRARAHHQIQVVAGDPIPADELGPFEHFLTARFRMWSVNRGMALVSDAAHPRWPLRRGRVTKLAQTHLECAGLPAPGGPPIVHFSDGVDVRIGPPRPVRP